MPRSIEMQLAGCDGRLLLTLARTRGYLRKPMKHQEIARQRLRNQRLVGMPLASPEEVVRWLGAMQAQEFAVAKWSIGQRARSTSDAALDQAIADGTILRTHILRPTWHFVLPADIRWMQHLTAPRVHAMNASSYRKLELGDAVFARSNALIAGALEGGNQLTRKQVARVLQNAGITAHGQRLAYLLMRAELDAVICSGAPIGKQQTYALLDERAPESRSLSRDQALAELTERYFTSRGPATLKDYTWWSSLTAAEAKKGLELVKSQLEHMVVADRTYWFAAPARTRSQVSQAAHVLQGYDEYIIAYSESRDVLDMTGMARAVLREDVTFFHAVVLDGQVVGLWRRMLEKNAVTIEVRPLPNFETTRKNAVEAAVDRYGEFIGLPTILCLCGSA